MWAVLKAKFSPRTRMAERLLMTGDAYLLEHNSTSGRDFLWSDNQDGEGQNWLGLQLMLLRDELRRSAGKSMDWTGYIQDDCKIDLPTGPSRDEGNARWQATVRQSTTAIQKQINERIMGTKYQIAVLKAEMSPVPPADCRRLTTVALNLKESLHTEPLLVSCLSVHRTRFTNCSST